MRSQWSQRPYSAAQRPPGGPWPVPRVSRNRCCNGMKSADRTDPLPHSSGAPDPQAVLSARAWRPIFSRGEWWCQFASRRCRIGNHVGLVGCRHGHNVAGHLRCPVGEADCCRPSKWKPTGGDGKSISVSTGEAREWSETFKWPTGPLSLR